MAVYQGARMRAVAVPANARAIGSRRITRAPARATRRVPRVTLVLAGLLVAFLLGLVYLTQTLQAGVTNIQIDDLLAERQHLMQQIQSQQGVIARWGSEPQVVQWAQQQGLNRLDAKVRVAPR